MLVILLDSTTFLTWGFPDVSVLAINSFEAKDIKQQIPRMMITHLVSLHSIWHSSPLLYYQHQFRRTSRWRCLHSWSWLAGKNHRPYPTRQSRPHPWFSVCRCSLQFWMRWIVKVLPFPPQLALPLFFSGWQDNCQDSLVIWQHLCQQGLRLNSSKGLARSCVPNAHLRCTLQGKHFSAARVLTQWLSQRGSKRRLHIGRSSKHH